MQDKTIYELKPNESHKSFYRKAFVEIDGGAETLFSYGTPVLRREADGRLTRLWSGWTATTGRHVRAFCGINKKGWDAMEVKV